MAVQLAEEWLDETQRIEYLNSTFLGRWLLNRERRLWGRPPLTLKECKAWRAEVARLNAEAHAQLKRRRSAENR